MSKHEIESIEKNARKSHKKFTGPKRFAHTNKSKRLTYHQFLLITFFAVTVLQLFLRIPNQHQIQRFDIYIAKNLRVLILGLFAHFEAKREAHENG
jgi:hypothetical protein